MKKRDPAKNCPNARLISAIYFGLLSVVGTILINALLTSIGIPEKVPLFKAIILGMVIASCMGAIMGDRIIHCPKPYLLKTFFMGFFMVIVSLPVFDLGLVYFMENENTEALFQTHTFFYGYFVILGYSYMLFGLALAVTSGIASMYLRGQLVYDILSTYQPDNTIKKLPESPAEKNKIEHSDRVSIKHHK